MKKLRFMKLVISDMVTNIHMSARLFGLKWINDQLTMAYFSTIA